MQAFSENNNGVGLQSASDYLKNGFAVVPLHYPVFESASAVRCSCGHADCRSIGKHPDGRLVPHGLNDATRSAQIVEAWWERAPSANIGVVPNSAAIVVLDLDSRSGGDQSLSDLQSEHGVLPPSWEVKTGGGGRHIYFRHPEGQQIGCSSGRVGPGLDIKAEGGMCVGAGSRHASGWRYRWLPGHHPTEVPLAAAPQWLIDRASASQGGNLSDTRVWNRSMERSVLEGQRNETITSLYGHLLGRNLKADLAAALLLGWNQRYCKPPLSDDEVIRCARSIARRELGRRVRRG